MTPALGRAGGMPFSLPHLPLPCPPWRPGLLPTPGTALPFSWQQEGEGNSPPVRARLEGLLLLLQTGQAGSPWVFREGSEKGWGPTLPPEPPCQGGSRRKDGSPRVSKAGSLPWPQSILALVVGTGCGPVLTGHLWGLSLSPGLAEGRAPNHTPPTCASPSALRPLSSLGRSLASL